jgi:hypothetical protein
MQSRDPPRPGRPGGAQESTSARRSIGENSLHKIETLIAAPERFRAGLAAEAELRALRERRANQE